MRQKNQLQFLVVAIIISALTTLWGHVEANEQHTVFDALYLTLQTAKLGAALENTTANWQLQIMRFVLPALTIFTLIVAILLSARHWAQFKALLFVPPEVVFLGAGRAASSLAKAFLDKGTRAVALDPDIEQEYARAIKQEGAILLPGSATDLDILKKLQVSRATRIYIATDDDMRNMETALAVMEMKPGTKGQKLVIRMADKTIQAAFMQHQTVKDFAARNDVIWLDLTANAARFVLQKYPLPGAARSDGNRHIGIFGFDALGQELLLQVVRTVIDPSSAPLRITVFAEKAGALERFLRCYPALDPAMRDQAIYRGLAPLAEVVHVPVRSGVVSPSAIIHADKEVPFSAFYVAAETDHESLAVTEQIAQVKTILRNRAPVVCCLPGTSFETSFDVKQGRGASLGEDVTFFHVTADQFHAWESFPGEVLDTCGMIVHEAYEYLNQHDVPVPLDQRWHQMNGKSGRATRWLKVDEKLRRSSRFSGDHFREKLRRLGFELSEDLLMLERSSGYIEVDKKELQTVLDDDQVEKLRRIEHRRFVIERLLDGWLYDKHRNRDRKLNPTLVHFDDLSDDEKLKDETIIRGIPTIVQELMTLSQLRAGPELRLYRRKDPHQASSN